MERVWFELRQIRRRMWFLPAAFSLVAVVTVVVAYFSAGLAPDELPFTMPSDAVVSILTILASSLLTVAVFALSTMVSAIAGASQTTTPRAVPLIIADRSAQTSISVFIGAFLFAIVGIIGLSAGVYSEAGRLILFVVTLAVVVLVVWALIGWIGQISAIGRVGETVDRVEAAASSAFAQLRDTPLFGCARQSGVPQDLFPVLSDKIGYVQHLDAPALQALAESQETRLHVTARPGAYADPARPLLHAERDLDEDAVAAIREAFVIGDSRTFDSDPRFGLIVLAEIGSRALSPGINDPGTAIDVIGTLVRVIASASAEAEGDMSEVAHDRVTMPQLSPDDLLADGFRPLARDGAGMLEVVLRLLKGLSTLEAMNDAALSAAAGRMRQEVGERALAVMEFHSDREAVRRAMTP